MWSVLFRQFDDELVAELWEAGTTGLLEEPDGLRAYFERKPSEIAHLGGELPEEAAEAQAVSEPEDRDPIPVGERLLIVPVAFQEAECSGRLLLRLESGAAFGTGRHETTQLCLEALERHLKPDDALLDVGCGSGVLSLAAKLLGAKSVVSCDIDEQAVAMTKRQVQTPVFLGSADAVASEKFDLVVANLTAPILDQLGWDLKRAVRPGGKVLLSGFLRERPPRCFVPEFEWERDGWLCWICERERMLGEQSREPLTHTREWWLSS